MLDQGQGNSNWVSLCLLLQAHLSAPMLSIMNITAWPGGLSPQAKKVIREIFFVSASRKDFRDESERERFFQKWTEYYFSEHPRFVYTASDQQGLIIGYLTGCPDSHQALSHYKDQISSYSLFGDLFARFPAHLHINLAESARGKGVGSTLIKAFIRDLSGCLGVHIVTSPNQRNVEFYRKNAFTFEVVREFGGNKYLFMGRSLETEV